VVVLYARIGAPTTRPEPRRLRPTRTPRGPRRHPEATNTP
jgi:hypothetical protein